MTTLYRGTALQAQRHFASVWARTGFGGSLSTTTTTTNNVRTYASSKAVYEKPANDDKAPAGIPYANLTVGVPKEHFPLEKRVAATPESVARMVKPGLHVAIETGAGAASNFADADYQAAGATIVDNVWKDSDIVMKVCLVVFCCCCCCILCGAVLLKYVDSCLVVSIAVVAPSTHQGRSHGLG